MRSVRDVREAAEERLGVDFVAICASHAWSDGDGLGYVVRRSCTFHADGTCERLRGASRSVCVYPIPYLRSQHWTEPCPGCTT